MGLHCILRGQSDFLLYYDDVRISQETHLWAFTACYIYGFNSLYVDVDRTSQKTGIWAPWSVAGRALLVYKDMMFIPHRKHACEPPRPVTETAFLLYVNDVCISQKTHT
jgi:hypothetical protein